ncbi:MULTISPECIES: proteasome-activating nucleotidase Pan2 [Halococcus]|uniref:Proteasome-activating nucleotidase n=1 Tax=Halococcus salifodinae DSM 8989 TaxID=1227456 RepID=M0N2U4_9EURY|nr:MULTISPECIES: proteasome-activating nucleotidase [Halococcus]EMA52191.1 proteasome-activating nucleotidase [Halococcus salifodinae DSM 8989]
MSHSPSLPDRPRLDLDPELTDAEQVSALDEHLAEIAQVHDELAERLDDAEARREELESEAGRLQRENETLKTSSLYVATVEELTDEGAIVRQHGNNQEVLTEISPTLEEEIGNGDRVAVNDSFSVQQTLSSETDARAQAMQVDTRPQVTYGDIGGIDDQIREVREAVELPLKSPERFDTVGIEPPTGVLLHGPPGTGKTMLAKAVANGTDATFIKMAGSELVRKFIGEGARLVRDLFELANEHEPAVIFIDELDAVAAKRTDSKTSGDAEVQRTMMQLLNEMDGFDERGDVSIIAATNRFDMLDPAILRPGRFDRLIEVPEPDAEGREQIFQIHTRGTTLDDDVDFEALAELTAGRSGAEIESLATEAGMFAIREERTEVEMDDFEAALEKVTDDDTAAEPIAFH